MKAPRSKRSGISAFPLIVLIVLCCILPLLLAEAPSWWHERGVVLTSGSGQPVAASDYAATNQGQLKEFAVATYEMFLIKCAGLGGIGDIIPASSSNPLGSPCWRIRQLIQQWVVLNADGTVQRAGNQRVLAAGAASQKDYAAINLGQIKAVAAPFYDRLAELYWSYNSGTQDPSLLDPAWAKPWTEGAGNANDYAMANLGQLKRVFAINFDSDADGDGLTNLVELLKNKNRNGSWTDLGNAYTMGGVLTDKEQDDLGLDPTNPINGVPPIAPTGLHITFRDASVHPDDPDLSQIKVEWNAPTQPNIAVTFSESYTGNPAGWGTPIPPVSNTASRDITVEFSKRIYGYRVTFTALNRLSASSEIAYELPLIRGIMIRKKATGFKFWGPTLYETQEIAVPRKFRTFTYDWSYDEDTTYDDGSTDVLSYSGQGHQSYDLLLDRHSAHNWISGTELYSDETLVDERFDQAVDVELTAPLPVAPTAGVVATPHWTSSNHLARFGHTVGWTYDYHLALSVEPYSSIGTGGQAVVPAPYGSLSGSYALYDFDNSRFNPPGTVFDSTTDTGTISLLLEADNQRPVVNRDIVVTNPPATYHYDHEPAWLPEPPADSWALVPGNFSIGSAFVDAAPFPYPGGAPYGATGTQSVVSKTWSRSWVYDWTDPFSGSDGRDTWSETFTPSDEVTTDQMVAAAVASVADFGAVGVPWYRPYAGLTSKRFENATMQSDLAWNTFLSWDYTASYTSGAAGTNLGSAGSGRSYVYIEPNISGLVGQYSLNADETSGSLLSSEYKFRLYPPAESTEVIWSEVFTPQAVASGSAASLQRKVRSVTVLPTQTETSQIWTVDRTEGWASSGAQPGNQAQAQPPPPGTVALGAKPIQLLQATPDGNGEIVRFPYTQIPILTNVEGTKGIRFCRWLGAFYGLTTADMGRFPKDDPDYFVVRVLCENKKDAGHIAVKCFTKRTDGQILDTGADITLNESPANSGNFESDPLALVADADDDELTPFDGNALDRTFRGVAGGKIVVRVPDLDNATAEFPIQTPMHRLSVKFLFLDPPTGFPVTAHMTGGPPQVELQIVESDYDKYWNEQRQFCEEVFATLGIDFHAERLTPANDPDPAVSAARPKLQTALRDNDFDPSKLDATAKTAYDALRPQDHLMVIMVPSYFSGNSASGASTTVVTTVMTPDGKISRRDNSWCYVSIAQLKRASVQLHASAHEIGHALSLEHTIQTNSGVINRKGYHLMADGLTTYGIQHEPKTDSKRFVWDDIKHLLISPERFTSKYLVPVP